MTRTRIRTRAWGGALVRRISLRRTRTRTRGINVRVRLLGRHISSASVSGSPLPTMPPNLPTGFAPAEPNPEPEPEPDPEPLSEAAIRARLHDLGLHFGHR